MAASPANEDVSQTRTPLTPCDYYIIKYKETLKLKDEVGMGLLYYIPTLVFLDSYSYPDSDLLVLSILNLCNPLQLLFIMLVLGWPVIDRHRGALTAWLVYSSLASHTVTLQSPRERGSGNFAYIELCCWNAIMDRFT